MKIENVKVEKIVPYIRNNKEHNKKQVNMIANSIKEFGFNQPLVINKDNVVVVGHWRLLAAKELGLKEVPCVRMENLTDKQIDKYRILDNKLNESDWSELNLKEELDILGDMNFGDLELSKEELFPDLFEEWGEILKEEKPEVEFTEELLEEHNYVVLYFDNTADWMVACDKLNLTTKKNLLWSGKGIGRVVKGSDVLDRIL